MRKSIILRKRPFVASVLDDDSSEYRFACPRCKGHNATKAQHSSGKNFLEGHYQCLDCGLQEYQQKMIGEERIAAINYYSDCFKRTLKHPTLF